MDPDKRKEPKDWKPLIKGYWPLAIGLGALIAWIVISIVVSAWLDRKPEYQLRRAVLDNDVGTVHLLLNRGAAVNHRFPRGYSTVLHHAAWAGKQEIARLLIEHGADPNIANATSGETPLHSATRGNEPEIVSLLLEAGANPWVRIMADSEQCVSGITYRAGSTAEDIAAQAGYDEVIRRLRGI